MSSGEDGALGSVSLLERGQETRMALAGEEQATLRLMVMVMLMQHREQRSGCCHRELLAVMPVLCSS